MNRQVVAGVVLTALAAGGAACGSGRSERRPIDTVRWGRMDPMEKHHPDVLQARLVSVGRHRYDLTVTISSPYDTRFRFADGWRILTSRGDWLGERHFRADHADEQPWTRTLRRIRIPPGVQQVVVEGRDLRYGWGGAAFFLRVP
jgi:hypothetical protein